jgi:hypothetical protein
MERKGRRTRLYASAIPFMLLVVILANEVIVASGRPSLPIWLWFVVGVAAGTVMGELSTRLSERLSELI